MRDFLRYFLKKLNGEDYYVLNGEAPLIKNSYDVRTVTCLIVLIMILDSARLPAAPCGRLRRIGGTLLGSLDPTLQYTTLRYPTLHYTTQLF
jgi:hypothetical protein